MAIKNIIFDFGGVLINWDPHVPFIKAFNGDEEKAQWFIKNICNHEWNMRLDKGMSFDDGIREKIELFPDYADYIHLYKSEWIHTVTGAIEGTVDILSKLKEQHPYRLLGITNWSGETFPLAKVKFPFLNWFEDIVVSGDVKMVKPDAEIFEYAMKRFTVEPEESIFIDDNADNFKQAESMGIQAIHFKNPKQLREDLERFGVKV